MRQESDNSTPFTPPSLSDLLARFVAEQSERLAGGGLPFEPGSEVQLHEAGAAQAADPRLAWEEAVAALQTAVKSELPRPSAVPDWSGLVSAQEPALDIAFCAGNFPQMVRNLGLLLQSESSGPPAQAARALPAAGLTQWAEASATKPFPQVLLAAGLLRLAHDLERAGRLLKGVAATVPAEWKAAWRNEEAALAWHAGRREEAARLWTGIEGSVPALFNRGMAALFLGKPAAAVAPLRQAVAQLPESSSWHHLGQLYLTLAEMRQ